MILTQDFLAEKAQSDDLSAKDRKKLDTSQFGLPEKRKYPLNDEEHVRKAIQMFSYAKGKDKVILAKNIKRAIKKFGMTTKFDPQLKEESLTESLDYLLFEEKK